MFDKFSFTIVSLVESVVWNCIRYPEVPRSHLDVVLVLLERDRGHEAGPKFSVASVDVILNQWGGVRLNPSDPG